jgi:methyl-accepting chemotaxis protein
LERRADLDTIQGSEQPYNLTHTQQHPVYHDLQIDHGSADIFILDIRGNLIYSVKKAKDYGTNFDPSGNGPYRTSGLGKAWKAAVDHPHNVHYVDWELYEATGYQAAFFSSGIINADGETVGVYAIELPSTYVQSIDEVEEECSLPALRASYEGAINIGGLGKPLVEDMESPLDQSCYKG